MPAIKGGLIIFGLAPALNCVVRNISDKGAMLKANPIGVPDAFTLVIKPEMVKRGCQVVWRSTDKVGVSFV